MKIPRMLRERLMVLRTVSTDQDEETEKDQRNERKEKEISPELLESTEIRAGRALLIYSLSASNSQLPTRITGAMLLPIIPASAMAATVALAQAIPSSQPSPSLAVSRYLKMTWRCCSSCSPCRGEQQLEKKQSLGVIAFHQVILAAQSVSPSGCAILAVPWRQRNAYQFIGKSEWEAQGVGE